MEEDSPKEDFQSFLTSIFKVNLLNELEKFPLEITYKSQTLQLNTLYPFYTVQDLKYAIYEALGKVPEALPNNQLLFYKRTSDTIQVVDFLWDLPSKYIKAPGQFLNQFVTSSGAKNPIQLNIYHNKLLENIVTKRKIQLLLYKDVISSLPQPLSEKEFNGRIVPFFPFLKMNETYPNEKDLKSVESRLLYNEKRNQFIERIQNLLSEDLPLIQQTLSGLKFLKLSWYEQSIPEKIKTFFFELDVNDHRPYLRLLPVGSTPISKIQLKDIDKKIPNISDIRYLQNWADEKSPTPERDYVIGKVALPSTILNLPNIYGTIRLYDDASFDVIVEPPKDIRKLDPFSDFVDGIKGFSESLENGIGSINREKQLPYLKSGNFVFGMKIPSTYKRVTRKVLKDRLLMFSPFFQEIPPLPNDQPVIMLRYKCVDNFSTEDNISNFLTQILNKNIYRDESNMMKDLSELLSEEFQLDIDSAREKLLNWFKKRSEVQQIVVGEKKEYTPVNNTGIDIAIYEKHPFYSFHYTNIDSVKNLQMVNTFLSLIMSLESEYFSVSKRDVATMEKAEVESQADEEEEEGEEDLNFEQQFDFDIGEADGSNSSDEEDSKKSPKQKLKEASEALIVPEAKAEVKEQKDEKEEELKGVANFFIRKLMEYDRRLFKYPITKPSDKSYVSQCSANETRQPAVLTPEQFARMIDEYKDDDVDFQIYPLKPGQKDTLSKSADPNNTITVLRYGSNPTKENYYVCSQFYCTRDDIVVLEKDFNGTKLRHPIKNDDGKTVTDKPKETCPFCMGKLIKDRKHPGINETVLQRIYKPSSKKRQLWINFLSKIYHPEGLRLPCCFTAPKPIKFKDTQRGVKPVKDDEEEDEEDEDYIERSTLGEPIVEYMSRLAGIAKNYIISEEKLPLEITKRGPQIGLLPKKLDPLFEQDASQLVSRKGNVLMLNDNAKGFLRIAVENRTTHLADSFLSALAPFFLKNSASQLKMRIIDVLQPRVFIQMNYGNLVLEFYDPKKPPIKNRKRLELWANQKLGIQMNKENELEVERIYNSYTNFIEWLDSEKTVKEYRQFSMILSQANLIQGRVGRPGTTVIVIDIFKDDSVSVRCPTYGYNAELMDNNDVIFLMHHHSGIWEPLFYVDNTTVDDIRDKDLFTLVFQKGRYNGWPDVVKKLYGEFRRSCSGPGKTVYTSQSFINSNAIISLSGAQRLLLNVSKKYNNIFFNGMLRDAYNHVAAVVIEEQQDGESYHVALPVVDDGVLITDKALYLNWNDFYPAPLEETLRIYKNYLLPFISARYPGYNLDKYVVSKKTNSLVGVQLKNLMYIPVEEQDVKTINKDLVTLIDDFEYDINRDIILKKTTNYKDVEMTFLKEEDLEEIYQHLRISFANYLTGERGSSIKERLEDDILSNKKMPLKEKRKRMFVLFGSEVQSWLSTEKGESTFSFVRNDCRTLSQDLCHGNCVWATAENKCKIHVPETTEINIGTLLTVRLMDEIIRYSEKQREIFENDLTRLVFFKKPIRIGDQYIVPENTLEWSDMLRIIWSEKLFETPRFFEEITTEKDIRIIKEEEEILKPLNTKLKSYLNPEDSKTSSLQYLEITKTPSLLPILYSLGLSESDLKISEEQLLFSDTQLRSLTQLRKGSYIQLNLTTDPVTINYYKVSGGKFKAYPVYVIIVDKGSTGFLVKSKDSDSISYSDLPDVLQNIMI